jgi:molybdopterin molybdotransferase
VKNNFTELFDVIDHLTNFSFDLIDEYCSIEAGTQKVLSADIYANEDIPFYNRSRMDGYAFDSSICDLSKGLKVVGFIGANERFDGVLGVNECVKCSTGSNLINNLNTVVPVEYCHIRDEMVLIEHTFESNESFIEKKGSIIRKGNIILKKGTALTHREIERLAQNRINQICVKKMPHISIISTGSELTELFANSSSILNSNFYMISSFLSSRKIPFSYLGIIQDNDKEIARAINNAQKTSDIIMTIGGTAFGQRDLIKSVAASLGGILYNDMVNVNPGKTFKFGGIQGKPLFVIPGNPASATICVEIFFNIFINSIYYGKKPDFIKAISKATINKKRGFYKLIPGFITFEGNRIIFYDKFPEGNSTYFTAIGLMDKNKDELKEGDLIDVFITA